MVSEPVIPASTSDLPAAWDALFQALGAETEQIGLRVREAMQAQLPTYRAMDGAQLDREVRLEVERVLASARAGSSAVTDREFAELAAVGDERARQGVPVEEMLRAWRIGVQVVIGYASEVGSRLSVDADDVLEFVQSVLAWSDVAMVSTARAHRNAELELARQEREHRESFVRGVLFGTLAPVHVMMTAGGYGVDPGRTYHAVRARAKDEAARRRLEQTLGFDEALEHRRGLSAVVDGDLVGFLPCAPLGNIDGVVGVGSAQPLDRLAESFRLATRALETAASFGMTGIYDLPGLGLRAAVSADRDVGEALTARYLDPLNGSGSRPELIASVRVLLACGLHVDRAAERLFVHPNTLRYRIGRFEELVGASIRDPGIAFEVWWALETSAMRHGQRDQGEAP